ncbi:WD40 repeat domain-containing protein [Roseofilum casamattae]|uniref:NWD2 C-terminal beta-propeller domain-containing protein n=1 Tax=Roseofilum casamattae BLCC-M143 TaxID=3022442 RepID=A0ABT7BXE4_9CYAN|nr:hypothetical protein [Roseofilum casamattae]MDJ1182963.1 hypothetical protein [Roseofilum casamattae BLCC-M143]
MRLLPYYRLTITTEQSLARVIESLSPHIRPTPTWGNKRVNLDRGFPLYYGTLSDSGFKICRVIHYRNSFLPQISGRFESSPDRHPIVRMTFSLHPVVIAFMLFWCYSWFGLLGIFFLGSLFSGDIYPEILLFLSFSLMVLSLFWMAFWSEVRRSQNELTEIILGERLPLKSSRINSGIILFGGAIAALITSGFSILPNLLAAPPLVSQPSDLNRCSLATTESQYCQFSLRHSLSDHPTASAIAISPDGTLLATGGRDKAIRVWELETGKLIKTLQSDSGAIASLAIAEDNQTIVSGSGDRMVRIWNLNSDNRPKLLKGHEDYTVSSVVISSNGEQIISGSLNEINYWDLTTGALLKSLPDGQTKSVKIGPINLETHSQTIKVLSISPTGNRALVREGNKLIVWDLRGDRYIELKQKPFQSIHYGRFSPDDRFLVTTSYSQPNSYLQIWNTQTGELQAETLLSSAGNHWTRIALSRDRIMAIAQDGWKVFHLPTAQLDATLNFPAIHAITLSPNGKYLVGLIGDTTSETVTIEIFQQP